MAENQDSSKQARGGRARANKLSPSERSSIASAAAKARWTQVDDGLPKATHSGVLKIGDLNIPCAVLTDGRRMLSTRITTALGSRSGASKRLKRAAQQDGAPLPIFLAPSNIKPFISRELMAGLLEPEKYRSGSRVVIGYEAKWLPEICDVWLQAREAGDLQTQQHDRAKNAEILIRGLAQIGIIALVDEATGYQEDRDKDELHRLLAVYLSEERLKWAKRFPDEFYRQIYRLRGWLWPTGVRRTPYIGKITNLVVYEKLPPGVLTELQVRIRRLRELDAGNGVTTSSCLRTSGNRICATISYRSSRSCAHRKLRPVRGQL